MSSWASRTRARWDLPLPPQPTTAIPSTGTDASGSRAGVRAGAFTLAEVSGLAMPDGHKRSIATWYGRLVTAT